MADTVFHTPVGRAKLKAVNSLPRITFFVTAEFERQYEEGTRSFEKSFWVKDDGWQIRIETPGGSLLGWAMNQPDSKRQPHHATALELVRKYLEEHQGEF